MKTTIPFLLLILFASFAFGNQENTESNRDIQELPIMVDFELFDGINLHEVYPGWNQGKGLPPTPSTMSSSAWFRANILHGSVAAAVIYSYTGLKDEWIISPRFEATENTKLGFMAALTRFWDDPVQGFFSHNDSVSVMVATTGYNFTQTVYSFKLGNQPPWEGAYYDISLGEFAGQTIRIAFYATNGQDPNSLAAFHIDDIVIKDAVPRDALAFDLVHPAPETCFEEGMPVVARIKNDGLEPISSVPVRVRVRGANILNLFGAYEGIIEPGEYADVEVGIMDQIPYGEYHFEITAELPGDGFAYNDVSDVFVRHHQDAIELPLPKMTFIGFYQHNLGDIYPGWYEARGRDWPRVAMNTDWQGQNYDGARTANVYFTGLGTEDWMVGPAFTAGDNLVVELRAALELDWNADQMGSDDKLAIMVSADCGTTWEEVAAFTQQSGVTESLQPFTKTIEGYGGQEIILAFYATTGTVNDPESYIFHITDVKIKNLYAHDAGVTHLFSPTGSCAFSEEEEVSVRIENFGSETISNFQVAYQLNDADPVVEIVTQSLQYGESLDYTFDQTLDLSDGTEFFISVYTLLEDDENPGNDGLYDIPIRLSAFDLSTEGAYIMGFEEDEDFDDWIVEDGNNDGITWELTYDPQHANSGDYSFAYFSNQSSVPSDDWLISPCFNLEAGVTYYVSFYYKNRATVWPESLRLKIGQEPSGDAMVQELIDLGEISNPPYMKAETTFTVDESGSWYFGWHAYGPPDQFGMHVDDITIYQVFDYDLAVTNHLRPREKDENCQLQEAGFVEIEITNFGAEDIDAFSVGVMVNEETHSIPFNINIESGESLWLLVENGFAIPPDQTVDISIWTEHPQDINHANDTIHLPAYLMSQFYTSFEGEEDLSEWSTLSLAGVNEWHQLENPSVSRTGDFVYAIRTDGAGGNTANDDWLFSECFYLEAGTCYEISFYYRSHFSTENLRLHMGTDQSPGAMDQLLIDLPEFSSNNYMFASQQFTVEESGIYYFGWHTDGGTSGRYFIYLDDVAIVEDLESQPVAEPGYLILDHEVAFFANAVNVSSFQWDFGDGNVSSDENPFHTYAEAGLYEVQLTVGSGCVDQTYTFDLLLDIPSYQVVFVVTGLDDQIIEGAVISVDQLANDPGDYVFQLIQGGYYYSVEKDEHSSDGYFTVTNEDLLIPVMLPIEGDEDDTSIGEIASGDLLNIFPNPVSDRLYVDFEGAVTELLVLSLSGREIIRRDNKETGPGHMAVNVSDLKPGTYILSIVSDGKRHQVVFVKL